MIHYGHVHDYTWLWLRMGMGMGMGRGQGYENKPIPTQSDHHGARTSKRRHKQPKPTWLLSRNYDPVLPPFQVSITPKSRSLQLRAVSVLK